MSKSRSEQKREDIIAAAKYAFKEFGVRDTSMDKLAEIAGVSKRTVYNHFATKEALVMFLITEQWEQATIQPGGEFDPSIGVKEQLTALLRAEVDMINTQEYLDLSRVAVGHLFYSPSELQREVEKMSCKETAIERWIKAAQEAGALKIDDAELAAHQIHDLMKGSCFWPQLFNMEPILTEERKDYLINETITMFLARYE